MRASFYVRFFYAHHPNLYKDVILWPRLNAWRHTWHKVVIPSRTGYISALTQNGRIKSMFLRFKDIHNKTHLLNPKTISLIIGNREVTEIHIESGRKPLEIIIVNAHIKRVVFRLRHVKGIRLDLARQVQQK